MTRWEQIPDGWPEERRELFDGWDLEISDDLQWLTYTDTTGETRTVDMWDALCLLVEHDEHATPGWQTTGDGRTLPEIIADAKRKAKDAPFAGRCSNCRWWEDRAEPLWTEDMFPDAPAEPIGTCHLNPEPTRTRPAYWCSHHTPGTPNSTG